MIPQMNTLIASYSQETMSETIQILGLPVHDITMKTALTKIDGFIRDFNYDDLPRHIITADASMLVMAQEDRVLNEIIQNSALTTPDSIGVLWAAKQQGRVLQERVSGVEIVERLCALSPERGYRIYFLGAAQIGRASCRERVSPRV